MSFESCYRGTTASGAPLPVRTSLSASGHWAELTADDLTETGIVLSTGPLPDQMAEQSHVEREDPSWLLHDYTHRMGSVLRAAAPRLWGSGSTGDVVRRAPDGDPSAGPGITGHSGTAPASALHLGAGALTLPRWIEERWPQVSQTVVDIEPELVDFVLEHVPMRTRPENVVADAAQVVRPWGELVGRRFDVVIVDLFNSSAAPEELTSAEFLVAVLEMLTARGLLLVNLGDDAGMNFARGLVRRLLGAAEGHAVLTADQEVSAAEDAAARAGASQGWAAATGQEPERRPKPGLMPGAMERPASSALLTAPDPVLAGTEEGNLVFACTPSSSFTEAERQLIWAAGPHPGDVFTGEELQDWAH